MSERTLIVGSLLTRLQIRGSFELDAAGQLNYIPPQEQTDTYNIHTTPTPTPPPFPQLSNETNTHSSLTHGANNTQHRSNPFFKSQSARCATASRDEPRHGHGQEVYFCPATCSSTVYIEYPSSSVIRQKKATWRNIDA